MKTALVVGGGSDIGAGIAAGLIAQGMTVVLADTDATATELNARKISAHQVVMLTEPEHARHVVEDIVARHGALDILISAPFKDSGPPKPFHQMPTDAWQHTLGCEFYHPLALIRFALPHMIERGTGHIISVISTAALRGRKGYSIHSAAEAAMLCAVRGIAGECAGFGIRVNAITFLPPIEAVDVSEGLPPRESVEPGSDLSAIISFLLSDGARPITGACIDATGGWLLH